MNNKLKKLQYSKPRSSRMEMETLNQAKPSYFSASLGKAQPARGSVKLPAAAWRFLNFSMESEMENHDSFYIFNLRMSHSTEKAMVHNF